MEFTACHNNILLQEEPFSQKSHSETPVRMLEKLTLCFDKDLRKLLP